MAIRYGFIVEYTDELGSPSACSGGENTQELALEAMKRYRAYYVQIGRIITRCAVLSWHCETCGNLGYLPRPKRGKNAAPWMPRPVCRKCKGTGGEKLVHEEKYHDPLCVPRG